MSATAPPLALTDTERELQIDAAYSRMCRAVQTEDQRRHWFEMVDLVRQRSPEQIKSIERRLRLRR